MGVRAWGGVGVAERQTDGDRETEKDRDRNRESLNRLILIRRDIPLGI